MNKKFIFTFFKGVIFSLLNVVTGLLIEAIHQSDIKSVDTLDILDTLK